MQICKNRPSILASVGLDHTLLYECEGPSLALAQATVLRCVTRPRRKFMVKIGDGQRVLEVWARRVRGVRVGRFLGCKV